MKCKLAEKIRAGPEKGKTWCKGRKMICLHPSDPGICLYFVREF